MRDPTEKIGPPQPVIHKNSISKRNSFLVVLYLYVGWVFDGWVGGYYGRLIGWSSGGMGLDNWW